MFAEWRALRVVEVTDPLAGHDVIRHLAPVLPHDSVRRLAQVLEPAAWLHTARQETEDRTPSEGPVPTGRDERLDVARLRPPTERGRRNADQVARFLDGQPGAGGRGRVLHPILDFPDPLGYAQFARIARSIPTPFSPVTGRLGDSRVPIGPRSFALSALPRGLPLHLRLSSGRGRYG